MESAESGYDYSSESGYGCYRSEPPKFNAKTAKGRNYTNVSQIDKLIEELENSMPSQTSNYRLNDAIEKRKLQLAELKKLRSEALIKEQEEKKRKEEERLYSKISQENQVIDDIIRKLKDSYGKHL